MDGSRRTRKVGLVEFQACLRDGLRNLCPPHDDDGRHLIIVACTVSIIDRPSADYFLFHKSVQLTIIRRLTVTPHGEEGTYHYYSYEAVCNNRDGVKMLQDLHIWRDRVRPICSPRGRLYLVMQSPWNIIYVY
jgi:hypothetical protein